MTDVQESDVRDQGSNALLPPTASGVERCFAATAADAEALPVPLRTLWNPRTCPAHLLPWLAWACSVDRWDATWPEAIKRQVIADAWAVHKHKGTLSALRRVVEPFGYLMEATEWFQSNPEGTPGTFRLRIGMLGQGISDERHAEMVRLILDAKPVSRQLTGLELVQEIRGTLYAGAVCFTGGTTIIYPPECEDVALEAPVSIGATLHQVNRLAIYPS
jgi:phage tail P2-like protein